MTASGHGRLRGRVKLGVSLLNRRLFMAGEYRAIPEVAAIPDWVGLRQGAGKTRRPAAPIGAAYFARAAWACFTKASKAAGSWKARSAITLRSSSMPARLMPLMNWE